MEITRAEKKYQELCNKASDINEHLPTLKRYALECDHITEMGVRGIVSTYAFIAGLPKILRSIDIDHPSKCGGDLSLVESIASEVGISFEFVQGSTLDMKIEETEILFIDTKHNYYQLREELRLHGNMSSKYIIFHDTTTFGRRNEFPQAGVQGLMPAIEEFVGLNPHWKCDKVFHNNNGLLVLKRYDNE